MRTLAATTFTALLLSTGTALADAKCQDFTIEVDNDFLVNGHEEAIKVTDVRYYDYEDGKWRDEALDNKVVQFHADVASWKKNLEYIGNEDTVLEISFRHDTGAGWSSTVHKVQSPIFRCNDNEKFRVVAE